MTQKEDTKQYWRRQLHRIKTEVDALHGAIDAEQRDQCFVHIQAIDGVLQTLRASVRQNMKEKI